MKALALALRRPVWAIAVMFALLLVVGIGASVGGALAASPAPVPGVMMAAPPAQSADIGQIQTGKPGTGPAQGTPTPTITGTPPTSTRTRTATATATNTPTPCGQYTITSSTGATVVPATTLVAGSNCDDCVVPISLPFSFSLYSQSFTTVNASSNGNLQFSSSDNQWTNTCLPATTFNNSILPHWDDQLLTGTGQGIFTLVTGTAPNRVLNIEWKGGYFSGGGTVDYEVRLFENSSNFEIIYGTVTQGGSGATVGVQLGTGAAFTQFECNTGGLSAGLKLTFTAPVCTTPTHTPTRTPTSTPTVACTPANFSDVHPTDYFYTAVQYLTCLGAISGYSDGTFRPFNDTTRGQLTKIVVIAEGFPIDTTGGPHFTDVPTTNPFYVFIETAYNRGLVSGYSDGTFRWGNNVTRGQLSKIIVQAEGWPIDTTGGPHFTDVPTTNPFYVFVETAYNHGIISGYSDGTFRPQNNATRGQISVIVYRALTQP